MGAFLAGVMLGSTPLRYQLVGQLGPTRDLLMAVFFLSVGLVVDPALVARNLPIVLGLAAALMTIKLACTAVSCWAAGMTGRGSVLTGVYNINAGEFTFVLLAAAGSLSIITQEHAALAVAVAALTLIATPLLVSPAHAASAALSRLPLAPWIRSTALQDPASTAPGPESVSEAASSDGTTQIASSNASDASATNAALARHVIIAGYGPGGRAVADRFATLGVPVCIVDLNASTVLRQSSAVDASFMVTSAILKCLKLRASQKLAP
jgi:CPA2 family monovalent cation:H+ antiporter-2